MSDDLEALEAQFSDYIDGEMSAEDKAAFEAKLAASPEARAAFEEFKKTIEAVSGMHKMSAPQHFDHGVTETIHKRSAGRFFGRKAFGDRVPFELLAVVALGVMLAIYLVVRASGTGSAKVPTTSDDDAPDVTPGAREALPRP